MQKNNLTTGEIFESLITVLINYDRNKDVLHKTPHRRFLDLALVPVLIKNIDIENSYEFIDSACINDMDISFDLFMDIAYFNYRRKMGTRMFSMFDYIKPFEDELCSESLDCVDYIPDISKGLYVVSNKYLMYGAAAMCNDELLELIGRYFKTDYYIIPSSINEILVFPKDEFINEDDCKEMIRTVNTFALGSPDQYLSDNLYKYVLSDKKIYIA